MTTDAYLEIFIALDTFSSAILKPAFSGTGCSFVFRIELLTGFGKANVWAVCTWLQETRSDNLYSIITTSLEQNVLVILTRLMQKVFRTYPQQFDQTVLVNVAEPSIVELARQGPETLVDLMRRKMNILREEVSLMQSYFFHSVLQFFVYSKLDKFESLYVLPYPRSSMLFTRKHYPS